MIKDGAHLVVTVSPVDGIIFLESVSFVSCPDIDAEAQLLDEVDDIYKSQFLGLRSSL